MMKNLFMDIDHLPFSQYTIGGKLCGACTVISSIIARMISDGIILNQTLLEKAFRAGIIVWNKISNGEYMGLDQVKEHFHRFLKGTKLMNIMVCCAIQIQKLEKPGYLHIVVIHHKVLVLVYKFHHIL